MPFVSHRPVEHGHVSPFVYIAFYSDDFLCSSCIFFHPSALLCQPDRCSDKGGWLIFTSTARYFDYSTQYWYKGVTTCIFLCYYWWSIANHISHKIIGINMGLSCEADHFFLLVGSSDGSLEVLWFANPAWLKWMKNPGRAPTKTWNSTNITKAK